MKKALKYIGYLVFGILAIVAIALLIMLAPALWNRLVTYPKLEKERSELWAKYTEPERYIDLKSFKGVIHAHTYWSHDSRGTLPEILDAAKQAKLQFIFNSDHKRHQLDTFPRGYHGVFDNIILESGTEHSSGLMISPFDTAVIDWQKPEDEIIREVVQNGGFAMYVHTEKEHDWDNPDYQAMEIYNIHTDLLDENSILPFVINNTINGKKYMHWGFRELFDEQTDILNNWDRLNQQRRIVGIGAVDAHNNQNFRARYLEAGRVEWVGPNADAIVVRESNWFDKMVMKAPDKYGWSFKWELDPYFNSYNFVNNHVFCDTFTNVNIKDHILQGHVLVSFESLAPANGFQYFAQNDQDSITAITGDSVNINNVHKFRAVSPFPARFELIENELIHEATEEGYEYISGSIIKPGNYRLVARLKITDKWIPWVYTNPIYLHE
jgi:hypothetical protein